MIEDKREDQRIHQILDAHTHEIMYVIRDHNVLANGKSGTELLEIHRKRNAVLEDVVHKQKRALAFMAGDKVEPETLLGEAVLLPVGGVGDQP